MRERAWGRLLAGDLDGTFPELVDAVQHQLYGGVVRLVGDAGVAEDLCQDVFLRAYRALSSMAPTERARLRVHPWLWTIALNRCRTWGRRTASRPREVELDPGWSDGDAPFEHATEDAAVWRERLAPLTSAQRTAVVLRHVCRFTYPEISEITGRPVGTVKADAHRGIARLRQGLAAETEREEAL
jgi:RNA polymerase sigma-70 factor, ECF subfamily